MADTSPRAAIVVAVIGVVGTLGTALIANWDKLFPRTSPQLVKPEPPVDSRVGKTNPVDEKLASPVPAAPIPAAPVDVTPQIAGVWQDVGYPSNGTKVSQDGARFTFTRWGVLTNGVPFQGTGSGTLSGRRVSGGYRVFYRNGGFSEGQCTGSIWPGDTRIDLECTDTQLGRYQSSSVRAR